MFEMNFTPFSVYSSIYSFKDIQIPRDFYPDMPYIYRCLFFRDRLNMNTFILIVGNPRTSKSYCSLKIAEIYSKEMGLNFDVNEQLTFDDIKKFLGWSMKAERSIFILDETGTSLSPDLFWSLQQRIMRRFVQTQGFRKNVLIWNLPSILFIQKGFRFMTNYSIRTVRQGLSDVFKVKVDQLLGKGYPLYIETMRYGLPKDNIVKEYERLKREWNDETLKDDITFLNSVENRTRNLSKPEILEMYKKGLMGFDKSLDSLIEIGYDMERGGLLLQNEKPF